MDSEGIGDEVSGEDSVCVGTGVIGTSRLQEDNIIKSINNNINDVLG